MKRIYSLCALVISGSVMFSWVTDTVPFVRSFSPPGELVTMKFYTALMFFCSISAFYFSGWMRDILTFALFALLGLSLTSAVTGSAASFALSDDGAHSIAPGIPSLSTLLCFLLLWGRLSYGNSNLAFRFFTAGWLALVSFLGILGYILHVPILYGMTSFSGAMAINTAICFGLMAVQGLIGALRDWRENEYKTNT